jgi:hypothetical protein
MSTTRFLLVRVLYNIVFGCSNLMQAGHVPRTVLFCLGMLLRRRSRGQRTPTLACLLHGRPFTVVPTSTLLGITS